MTRPTAASTILRDTTMKIDRHKHTRRRFGSDGELKEEARGRRVRRRDGSEEFEQFTTTTVSVDTSKNDE